ncbi:MAG: hypothetical protein ACYCT0_10955, partial [Sulfobacillus sp.]
MTRVELALDQVWPLPLQQRVAQYLKERWPTVEWKWLPLPWSQRDARNGPLLALLGGTANVPPGDPADVAVIRREWDSRDDPVTALDGLRPLLDFQVARIIAPKDGIDPNRHIELLPGSLTRRALLSLPHPIGQPLPAVPRVNAALCLGAIGCAQCLEVCAAEAIRISDNGVRIEADQCQTGGACV